MKIIMLLRWEVMIVVAWEVKMYCVSIYYKIPLHLRELEALFNRNQQ
jgi:hypothetical protein